MSDDLYANVTARIVAALERGVAPWVRPWSTGIDTLPMNAQTGRNYRGINVVLLAMESQRQGHALDRWLTYRQAAELGGQVRRGEQGSTVVFWRLKKLGATADAYPLDREEDVPERIIPLLRAYTVFDVAQVDGLPSKVLAVAKTTWEPEARAEELLIMSGAVIHHGGPIACYRPAADNIQLPPRARFPTAAHYYGTALRPSPCTALVSTFMPERICPTAKSKRSLNPRPRRSTTNARFSPAQLRYLKRLVVEARSSQEHIKDYFNLDRLEELPMKEFDRALQALRRAA